MRVFSFDAETNGLWGPVFAIGAVLRDGGTEISRFGGRCPIGGVPDPWVAEHVVPVIAGLAEYPCRDALLAAFAAYYLASKDGAEIIVHMGIPVEAGLLTEMHRLGLIGDREGPYPLIDVAGCLRQAGFDPTSVDAYAAAHGITSGEASAAHDPVYDSVITALVFEHLAGAPERSGA